MPCLIAAPCSGSGKTLLSLCLAALARQPHNIFLQKMDPLAEVFSG